MQHTSSFSPFVRFNNFTFILHQISSSLLFCECSLWESTEMPNEAGKAGSVWMRQWEIQTSFPGPLCCSQKNVVHELKLHCQIRCGAGHGGTFHCNELQNGDILSWFGWCWGLQPDRCYEQPACTSVDSPWLSHINKFNTRGIFGIISSCCFFIQGAFPAQWHLQFPSQGRPESLAPHHFLRQLAEQILVFLGCFQNPAPIP